ncbi:hypothetical protein Leryth_021247 [Lithospermum erythrorhizon]|nr:hypothetical protein Leryth_021247 [Lithospermum erythrorhizon]
MEETDSIVAAMNADQHLMAAAFHILKALEGRGSLSGDMEKILDDLSIQFGSMTKINEDEASGRGDNEYRLRCAQETIQNLQPNRLNIWESGRQELVDYLQAIEEVQGLKESFRSMSSEGAKKVEELDNQAQNILQTGMEKLQEVLICILGQNKHCFEQEYMSFRSCEASFGYEESTISTEDDSVGGSSRRESSSTETEEYLMDFVHPDVIPYLKSIAEVMLSLNYDNEFSQSFISFWKSELEEYFTILNVEHHSMEDVIRMEWEILHHKIKIWCRAAKSIFGFYLVNEKRLFDQVFGEVGSVNSMCFIEATKAAVFCLLNFGQAVAIAPQRPERLFSLLDMYEVLADHLQIVNTLFAGEAGSFIRTEFDKLVNKLGHTAKLIFLEFANQVASNSSTVPFANGGIPHLTKYVMNYIMLLESFGDTLNVLLTEESDNGSSNPSEQDNCSDISGQLSHHLHSLISILEAKMEEKSNLYEDNSLRHIFMMNNMHYIVKKIKHSKVRKYFGDEWMKEHIVKYKQHARTYERDTWGTLLIHLKDDGTKSKALKERCKVFTIVFEERCKVQRGWCIPDVQLREDLRITISQTVTQAYRAFFSRLTACSVCDKYIKYNVEQLESNILDLFEGSYKSMNHPRRR